MSMDEDGVGVCREESKYVVVAGDPQTHAHTCVEHLWAVFVLMSDRHGCPVTLLCEAHDPEPCDEECGKL